MSGGERSATRFIKVLSATGSPPSDPPLQKPFLRIGGCVCVGVHSPEPQIRLQSIDLDHYTTQQQRETSLKGLVIAAVYRVLLYPKVSC